MVRRARGVAPGILERLPTANAHIDVAFHLIVTDPTEHVLGQELLRHLVEDGYTSLKVFMTYEELALIGSRAAGDHVGRAPETGAMPDGACGEFRRDQVSHRPSWNAPAIRRRDFIATSRPIPALRARSHTPRNFALRAQDRYVPITIVHVSNGESDRRKSGRRRQRAESARARLYPQYLVC